MALGDLMDAVGVKAGVILAAFGGGAVRIAIFGIDGTGWKAALNGVISVAGGTITAIFLGPIGPSYLGWPATGSSTYAATFLVGVFFMEILKRVGDQLSKWAPAVNNNKRSGNE